MLKSILSVLLLTSLASCALFRTGSPLLSSEVDQLINQTRIVGEGRGRLGIDQHQYLFSYEAVTNQNKDWIMAVSIPLHGEEVMVLPELHLYESMKATEDSFQARIESALVDYFRSRPYLPKAMNREFIWGLRAMIRFSLASELGLSRNCVGSNNQYVCKMDNDTFEVKISDQRIKIKKELFSGYFFELHAENLTNSSFNRSNYFLHSSKTSTPILSLELFWK
jgi:hypothetical protein